MKPDSCIFAREYGNRLAVTAIALASYVMFKVTGTTEWDTLIHSPNRPQET